MELDECGESPSRPSSICCLLMHGEARARRPRGPRTTPARFVEVRTRQTVRFSVRLRAQKCKTILGRGSGSVDVVPGASTQHSTNSSLLRKNVRRTQLEVRAPSSCPVLDGFGNWPGVGSLC
nr:hypothetical protein PHYPA_019834 [Physcomitrium patens]